MTDTRPALAYGQHLITVAPEGVDDAISGVMARHEAELDEALAPFGVALSDLLQPTWMRIVRFGDVTPLGFTKTVTEDGVARTVLPLLDGLDGDRPAGGCCGSGAACSSAACTGTPRDERGGWVAPGDVAPPAEGEPVPEVEMVRSPRVARDV